MQRPMALAALVCLALTLPTPSAAGVTDEERRLYSLSLDRLLEGQARIMGIADRIRIESDLIFRIEIIDDLTFNFTTYYRFNNQPPHDVEKSDYGFTLGIGWSY